MSFQLQHGHIGNKEIEQAIEMFKNNYISDETGEIVYENKNIYLQRMNNYVKGEEFDDIEELISDSECSLDTYTSLENYKKQMLEWDEDYIFSEDDSDIIQALSEGDTIYVTNVAGNEYINDNKDTSILEAIGNGEQCCYTLKEAWDNLNDENYLDESLVIWLLK